MVVYHALTMSPPPIIDLTQDGPPQVHVVRDWRLSYGIGLGADANGETPRKRQKIENDVAAPLSAQDLDQKIQKEADPIIQAAVSRVAAKYEVESRELLVETKRSLLNDSAFRDEFSRKSYTISDGFKIRLRAQILDQAQGLAKKLSLNGKNAVNRPKTSFSPSRPMILEPPLSRPPPPDQRWTSAESRESIPQHHRPPIYSGPTLMSQVSTRQVAPRAPATQGYFPGASFDDAGVYDTFKAAVSRPSPRVPELKWKTPVKYQPSPVVISDGDTTEDEPVPSASKRYPTRQGPPRSYALAPPLEERPRTPPPESPMTTAAATSPQNVRLRVRAKALHARPRPNVSSQNTSAFPRLPGGSRPYLSRFEIDRLSEEIQKVIKADIDDKDVPLLLHVDFDVEEIEQLRDVVRSMLGLTAATSGGKAAEKDLAKQMTHPRISTVEVSRRALGKLRRRTPASIRAYLQDLAKGWTSKEQRVLVMDKDHVDKHEEVRRASRVTSMLFARELGAQRRFNLPRRYTNFKNELRKCLEDGLELRTEWTDCAGDIATVKWTSLDAFICGTTTHSDSRNQQYNKAGNLLLGSAKTGTLKAYSDHRVLRPVVREGDNATDAMRQSQDPWLYSSVVASDYDPVYDRAYTSGFDKTARVWKVTDSGLGMTLLGTWTHDGNVNFVEASKHVQGMVATAADVPADAVRIYNVDNKDIAGSHYASYSPSRIVDEDGNPIAADKWAYFPATMHWGLDETVRNLLLVGYSPRDRTDAGGDNIPEDRRNSGELCLWDGLTGERWRLIGNTVQNVFEVAWHPHQASFIAATSPKVSGVEDGVYTQIRIFRPSDNKEWKGKAFLEMQVLDCYGVDINELVITPNSVMYSYVAAGCTDGKTYVWDTARGDKPIHVLSHGAIIEEQSGEVSSVEDTGIKFIAWGTSPDRLYTGSSDGVVKVWDIRAQKKPLVRDLLECPAPVSFGSFSPDFSKLVVGDASGRVFLLTVDEAEDSPLTSGMFTTLRLPDGTTKTIRRPRPFLPHPDPPRPTHDADGTPLPPPESTASRARALVAAGLLAQHPDRTVGVVQGPRYAQLGLYRHDLHAGGDPAQALLARHENQQQQNVKMFAAGRSRSRGLAPLRGVPVEDPGVREGQERRNREAELDVGGLEAGLRREIERERVNEVEEGGWGDVEDSWGEDGVDDDGGDGDGDSDGEVSETDAKREVASDGGSD